MASRKGLDWLQLGKGGTYIDRVRKPLHCLIYITPFMVLYQVASALRPQIMQAVHASSGTVNYRVDVVAFVLLQKFFLLFGAAGTYLPMLTVVVLLLSLHLSHKDKWEWDGSMYLGMFIESIVWALPVFVIGMAVFRHVGMTGFAEMTALQAGDAQQLDAWTESILSIGAGVYEELLFRFIGITLLMMLFMDVFNMKMAGAIPLVIVISAVLFSAYHYLGNETFDAGRFCFRAAAGIYFAGIYIFRGFGIVVGAHAFYDLMAVAMNHR